MSGECHQDNGGVSDKQRNRFKKLDQLFEYENAVISAENKCGQLKEELDRLKQIYNQNGITNNNNNSETTKSLVSIKSPIRKIDNNSIVNKRSDLVEIESEKQCPIIVRQNSKSIGTDSTGAALATINNILKGITESIRIPEDFISHSQTQKANNENQEIHGVKGVKINSKSKQTTAEKSSITSKIKISSKLKPKKNPSKLTTKSSVQTLIRKNKKSLLKVIDQVISSKSQTEPEVKIVVSKVNSLNEKRSKKGIKRCRPGNTYTPYKTKHSKRHSTQDLVEIYHNKAVKESNSSDSNEAKNKKQELERKRDPTELVPPLDIPPDTKDIINPTKLILGSFCKNYEMPTFSSRMKQVAKFYMNNFNLKAIPFCPVASSAPSHNIGINIQQVMNMLKTKQITQKLSPTLAYNIGLAAGKWSDKPTSGIASNVASRIYSSCPLSKSVINYQRLQEAAKMQEPIEETDEPNEPQSPETQSIYITGPSGDVKINKCKERVWTADSEDQKCTCLPQKGIEFQQVYNKYGGIQTTKTQSDIKQVNEKSKEAIPATPLAGKEKKLKDVMKKLHDEFEAMNKKYENLSLQAQKNENDKSIKQQLDVLDKELDYKQEEIQMVMGLYNEVLALKQQVKNLKERTSKETVAIKSQSSKYNNYNPMATAGLLNKLLRQVQQFQTHYNKN